MAELILKDTKVFVGGHDLTGKLNATALDHGAEVKDITTFGDNSRRKIGGLKSVSARHEGYFDVDTVHEVLFDKIDMPSVPVSVCPVGAANGAIALFFKSVLSEYSPGGSVGEVMAFSVAAEGAGDLIGGKVMANVVAAESSGVAASIELGAVLTGQKVYAAIHVLDGTGTLDVTVESDADGDFDTGETTRITFDSATGIGSQFVELVGPVTDTHWRVAYSISGGTPSFTFIVIIGIQ